MFAFSGEAKPKKYAVEIIHECHEAWKKLIKGESPAGKIALNNTTVDGSVGKVSTSDASYQSLPAKNPQAPAPIDPSSECAVWKCANITVDKSFFISSASN